MIATNIYKDATAKVKRMLHGFLYDSMRLPVELRAETLWYSLWVVPNASATGTPAELVNILSSEQPEHNHRKRSDL